MTAHRSRILPAWLILSLLAALLWLPMDAHAAGVLFAAPAPSGNADCSTWADACTLQTALAAADSGEQVWVKQGFYLPGDASHPEATFALRSGVLVYGGFAGQETSLAQRDWQAHLSILSGDIEGNDVNADGNFISEGYSNLVGQNSYHVVTAEGVDNTGRLDGFMITAGYSNHDPDNCGGGVYTHLSTMTVSNLAFYGNFGNIGGGLCNRESGITADHLLFYGNYSGYGGGLYNSNVTNYTTTLSTFTNLAFYGNTGTLWGGGMCNEYTRYTLTNAVFSGNTTLVGGGVMNYIWVTSTLVNVTFSNNFANQYGGGFHNNSDSPSTLYNAVFWGNTAGGGNQIHFYTPPTIYNADIQGWGAYPYYHIIDADPRFLDPDGPDNLVGTPDDDLRLQYGSPAMDGGSDAALPAGLSTDLSGMPRILGSAVDLGAYELGRPLFIPVFLK